MTGLAAAARRRRAVAPSRAMRPGTSPLTSPISAGESGRHPPGRCFTSVDWTSGKTDMPVSGKLGKCSRAWGRLGSSELFSQTNCVCRWT